jgi:glutamine amidotransferase-like uncharacterized protein
MVWRLNTFISFVGKLPSQGLFHAIFLIFCINGFIACHGSNDKNASSSSSGGAALILLFNGTGVSSNDVEAIQEILSSNHLSYSTVNSSLLNRMTPSDFTKYRLLILPGGNFVIMGNGLSKNGADNIRVAVQHGLNYLGICAGAFLAGNSPYYNGFNLNSGVRFDFYSAENQGLHKASLSIRSPDVPTLDQYWEDGPQLSGWGLVVAKYPDDRPAVTEGKCGKSYVFLAGIHAEAPEAWRQGLNFNTPASTDNAYAAKLICAAYNGVLLSHY